MILRIPVRPVTVRLNGVDEKLFELAPGFCRATSEDQANNDALGQGAGQTSGAGGGGHILISNPLIEAFMAYINAGHGEGGPTGGNTGFGPQERVFIELVQLPVGNDGQGFTSDWTDVNENLSAV